MTAIWPAGPPKVGSEMRNQVRTAVRKGMAVCSCARTGSGAATGSGAGVGGAVSCGWGASRVMDVLVGRERAGGQCDPEGVPGAVVGTSWIGVAGAQQ